MRESIDYDFETFRLNEYHGKWLPVGVVSYMKVKPRGGANAQEPDEIFRTFIVCTCNQTEGHHQLLPVQLDGDGDLGAIDGNSMESLACLFNLWEIMFLAQEGGK